MPQSQRGHIYIVPHDVTRKSCVEKKLQKKEGKHVPCFCFLELLLPHPQSHFKEGLPFFFKLWLSAPRLLFQGLLVFADENPTAVEIQMYFPLPPGAAPSHSGQVNLPVTRHSCFGGFSSLACMPSALPRTSGSCVSQTERI